MKVFLFLFFPIVGMAQEIKEISDQELSTKVISAVKAEEISEVLKNSSEFNDCAAKGKFDKSKPNNIDEAQKCFADKIKGKSEKELQALSGKLGLQTFKLVPNNTNTEITKYLTSQLQKGLTGIDPDDPKDKLKKGKIVDQNIFIDLYKTILIKDSMFELTRFCFENLRKKKDEDSDPAGIISFSEYWGDDFAGPYTDTGKGGWGDLSNIDHKDDKKIYGAIFKSLGKFDPQKLNTFVLKSCAPQITELCADFTKDPKIKYGSNACLTKNKLTGIRKAFTDTQKVKEYFDQQLTGGTQIHFDSYLEFYQKDDKENSLDKLTNITSTSMLQNKKVDEDKAAELKKNCQTTPDTDECKAYFITDDSLDKTKHDSELRNDVLKTVELEKLSQLNGDPEKIKKYLEDAGYYDILKDIESGQLKPDDVSTRVAEVFDAKKEAELQMLQNKLGSRQMTEDQAKVDQGKGDKIVKNIQDVQDERSRLAQVVLFNNIISSQLKLTSKDDNKDLGRNIGAWRKEEDALKSAQIDQVDPDLFSNLKQANADAGDGIQGNQINDTGFIDSILGKSEDKSQKP